MRTALILLSVIFIFFIFFSAISSQNPNSDQTHDAAAKPRELICGGAGSCVHKISRALRGQKSDTQQQPGSENAKDSAKESLSKTKESVDDVTKLSEHGHPGEAVKSASAVGSTLRGDVLRNMTAAAMDVEKAALKKLGQFLKMMFSVQVKTLLNAMWLVLDLKFLSGLVGLLGFTVAYGISVWVVLISPYVLARTLPQWQVPVVERVVRDVYCWILVFCVFTAWIGHFLGRGIEGSFDGHSLFYTLFIILVNLFAMERRATKVLLEKINLENQLLEKRKMVPESSLTSGSKKNRPIDKDSAETVPAEAAAREAGEGEEPSESDESSTDTDDDDIEGKVEKLNVIIKNLNWWSTVFNNLTLVSLTWYLVTLAEHVYVYTQDVTYKNDGRTPGNT